MKGFMAELREVNAKAIFRERKKDGEEGKTKAGVITIGTQHSKKAAITMAIAFADLPQMENLWHSRG